MQLLKTLCQLHGTSGNEALVKEFLLDYIQKNQSSWKTKPIIFSGDEFQNCIVAVFGKPRTAIFTHMDSIGFTVQYQNELVEIGGPSVEDGYLLVGQDSKGTIEGILKINPENEKLTIDFPREIDRGTDLAFACDFRETEEAVQSCYLDNRLGVYVSLKLMETIENGIIIFSCWEEHGGGSVPYLAKFIYEKYQIHQTLICDITWVTEGVKHGKGVAISLRDRLIPRKKYIEKIVSILQESSIPFQLEVESSGSSDARELQSSEYPFDWCFIGAPESNVHSPNEKVYKKDIESMIAAYELLLKKL